MPLPKPVPVPTDPPNPNPSHFISQLDNTVGKSRQHETYSNKTTNPQVKCACAWGALLCCSPGNAACRRQLYLSQRAHFKHAPRCDRKCCGTTGQETEHLNFPPGTSLQGHARGSPSAAATPGERGPTLQHKPQVSSSARRKACGQERHEQDAAGAGTALVSLAAVCPSDPPCIPDSHCSRRDPSAIAALLRLFGFGQRLQTSSVPFPLRWKCRNVGGSCRKSRRDVCRDVCR